MFLLAASYYFYCQLSYAFGFLLAATTIIAFACSKAMHIKGSPNLKRIILIFGITFNLCVLGFFKYYNFFVGSIASTLEKVGFEANLPLLNIAVPIGISFFTFQTISYLVDVYSRKLPPEKNLINFSLYIAYFPKLLNGPIERGATLLPQISRKRSVDYNDIKQGVELILFGLVKKVAIADVISRQVSMGFDNPASSSATTLIVCAYLYSILIYCDFSGYTDMARGISRLFGINLSINFSQPYFSSSFREFWRRWHISLSSWLRDYLYIPLGGNRCSEIRIMFNLMLTMLLAGLWHGANWTFVFWGGFHGLMLVLEHLWQRITLHRTAATTTAATAYSLVVGIFKKILSVFLVFNLVTFAWIFFKAENFSNAFLFLQSIVRGNWHSVPEGLFCLIYSLVIILLIDIPQSFLKKQAYFYTFNPFARGFVYSLVLSLVILTWTSDYVPFVYFQF